MASFTVNTQVERDIKDGYEQSRSIRDVSKFEKTYDRAVAFGTSLPDSGPFAFVNTFYEQNQETIVAAATGLASLTVDGKSIENAISGFAETARVMIKGLDALAQVHPAIGVAVLAFKLVVTFDMTRRENNKKVLALKVEMQDMMSVLFELRHVRDPMEEGPDGAQLGARIQTLMEKIAKDIKDAGSACDAYMKKSFLAKTLKSKIYEGRLAEYGATFESNKTEIQRSLSMHTARGVDAANEKLDAQGLKIDSMEGKIDQVLQIFRKLDTPREKEVQKFLEENGGPKACVEKDELLAKLVTKSGETLSAVSGSILRRGGDDMGNARKALSKELQEDVDEMFKKNIVVFERKLDMQFAQLEDTIHQSSMYIITALRSGAHEKIMDHDLQTIWKEMGWKGSVKARHFVLALHDYYSDRSSRTGLESNVFPDTPVVASPPGSPTAQIALPAPSVDDKWTLAYVNVSHVQPIVEAVDDDGTGFVSIKEVNTFVTSRPPNWTLLQWLAYWAAGWHASVSSYKNKIYLQVQKVVRLLEHVLPVNRRLVDEYLASHPFIRLEHVLRSTKSFEPARHDPELNKLIDAFDRKEEERLTRNLTSVAYEVDTVETLGLVTGPGRIERYLFPLIYILLERDLRIIMLSCKSVLREDELFVGLGSLESIFGAVDERVDTIAGIFKQLHVDISSRLSIFAFGMFQIYYDKLYSGDDVEIARAENSYIKWSDDSSEADEEENLQGEIDSIPVEELKLGQADLTVLEESFMDPPSPYFADIPDEPTPLGHWAGHLWIIRPNGSAVSYLGLTEMRVETFSDGKIVGVGQTYSGVFKLDGTLNEHNDIKFHMRFEDGYTLLCEGKFNPDRQKLETSWALESEGHESDSDSDSDSASDQGEGNESHDEQETTKPVEETAAVETPPNVQSALFSRTPSHLARFRYYLSDFDKNPARARWTFARDAILHEVRVKRWSWDYLKSHIKETKRFIALSIRSRIDFWNITPNNKLNQEEINEITALRRYLDVRVARICMGLAIFHINRMMVYHAGYQCDFCHRELYETRMLCLVCLEKNYSDNIDLCKTDMTESVTRDKFIHDPSHTMVKYEHLSHDFEAAWSIPESRAIAARAKTALRATEEATHSKDEEVEGEVALTSHDAARSSKSARSIFCVCCSKPVTVPCWVCRDCTPDTFVCLECEEKKVAPPEDSTHELTDTLIRIGSSDPDPQTDADQFLLESRLAALETKVEERLTQLETKVQERFSVLESLLRQVLSQGGATSTPQITEA
ncbi:hypothetical protein BDN72DRAFT_207076 [Pluteus cervinus]|uniref:Uncharacterized protein n=1 Tax=Pluteus cervinus TaxID=181527 RepID=A0ACD3AHS8_9AGAR|nr:hypothetical protein BDN72DRAFT_207076 [Pluteus cervinus]